MFDPSAPALHDGIFGLPYTQEQSRVVLVPVPWEPTTSYRKGTAQGPQVILDASMQVDLFDGQTGRPYEQGIFMQTPDPEIVEWNTSATELAEPVIQAGGDVLTHPHISTHLNQVNALSQKLNQRVYEITRKLIQQNKLVGIIGGDHSTPYGSILAHAEAYPDLGILHIDAHADLRVAYEGFEHSHASIMYNVSKNISCLNRITQVGIRDLSEDEFKYIQDLSHKITSFFDGSIQDRMFLGETFNSIATSITDTLPMNVYISFDIDGLDPSLCPNTGTPVPGGLSFYQACAILASIVQSGRCIVGFDLNEVAPGNNGDWDGNVGARILYKLIGFMLMSQK